jgi:tetratricopeptide (TPR) repeat protein
LAEIVDRPAARLWLPLLVLALVSLAVFCRALGHDFLINWDDRQYVLDNAVIRGFSLDHLKTAFTTFYIGNYAPLHIISYMFDYQLWGLTLSLGTAYGMKGMTDAAIEQFTAAIRLNPGFAKAYYNLGNGLMNKGMFADALRCFETAVRLEPRNPALMTQLMKTRELLGQTGY